MRVLLGRVTAAFGAGRLLWPILGALALAGPACERTPPAQRVEMDRREQVPSPTQHREQDALRIAVGGMITPKEGFAYYRRFLDYIGEKAGRPVEFVDRESYAEINKLVQDGGVTMAFVCGGPYVEGKRQFGMELLAAPQAYGGTVYHSYIIVPAASQATRLEMLRGKKFAFTDPMSNTGALVPKFMLARIGETPEQFFSHVVFSGTHDKSISAVAEGLVDGAAVDSLIWEYTKRVNPALAAKTKVIVRSEPYGIPPVVVPSDLDPALKRQLRSILLEAHLDERGREILAGMMIDRFVPIEDGAYDSIRAMQAKIAGAGRP